MLRWGTLYQLVKKVPDERTIAVGRMLQDTCVQYFGPPVTVVADLGIELIGSDFQDQCSKNGTFILVFVARKHRGETGEPKDVEICSRN